MQHRIYHLTVKSKLDNAAEAINPSNFFDMIFSIIDSQGGSIGALEIDNDTYFNFSNEMIVQYIQYMKSLKRTQPHIKHLKIFCQHFNL